MRQASLPVLVLGLLCLASSLQAQSLDWALRTEAGFFNRAYQDREFLSRSKVSFAVPYGAIGAEFNHADAEGNLWGVSAAQTTVGAGKQFNWDQWEVQPLTMFNFGAVSAGKDFGWLELGLGIGGIVQIKDFSAQPYLGSDGTPGLGRAGGLDWNRRESYTLITTLLRVFPERGPHLALRIGRGPQSLTENLMHVQAVLPLKGSRLDAEIGFSSPLGLIYHGEGVLRSNERITVGWSFGGPDGRLGLRAGFLLRTIIQDTGPVDLPHRFSLAIDWSMSTQGKKFPAAR